MLSTVAMVIMKFYPRCKILASADISQWPDHHDSGTNPTYQYSYGVILSELKRKREKREGEKEGREQVEEEEKKGKDKEEDEMKGEAYRNPLRGAVAMVAT